MAFKGEATVVEPFLTWVMPIRRLALSYELVETMPVREGSVVLVILPAASYEYVVEFEFQSVTDVRRLPSLVGLAAVAAQLPSR
ncbi:hypothetical protein [Candidatus Amarobacter glycogenicus]|jgi:hypothetical protein|uniref:hypothetical protein n=1 Tax=Candidatus Amarobacter glycogenicus TaxID=3140699 RepID=UPI0031CC9EB5